MPLCIEEITHNTCFALSLSQSCEILQYTSQVLFAMQCKNSSMHTGCQTVYAMQFDIYALSNVQFLYAMQQHICFVGSLQYAQRSKLYASSQLYAIQCNSTYLVVSQQCTILYNVMKHCMHVIFQCTTDAQCATLNHVCIMLCYVYSMLLALTWTNFLCYALNLFCCALKSYHICAVELHCIKN